MESFLDDYADLGIDFFSDILLDETQAIEVPVVEPDAALSPYLVRSRNYWQQVPVPPDMSLAGTNVLAGLDDDTLLTMCPTLLAHIQRTEASGGLQVISPRMVTLGGIAARTGHTKRTPDMLLVGSAASRNLDWPVVRAPVPAHLFHGEPIDSYPSDPASRPKTVSTGLLPSTRLLSDPVTRAFLVGRALVDLQRRSDVGGSADELARVLARCWSIDVDSYEDMAEASLAPAGPLLRYAIRADDVYPAINAPVQAKKCISVGANATGRQLYGEDSAIDWRRLRVLAEAVFYQSSRLEGYTLAEMALAQPPGNPRALPNRPGVLQMRPLPGSVWSFEPKSFRLDLIADPAAIPGVRVPERVRASVQNYHELVRPVAIAAAAGMDISFSRTIQMQPKVASGETLTAGYRTVLQSHSTHSARGRTPVAAVRGFIYDALASSTRLPAIRALWLARYLQQTVEAHNLTHLLDFTTTRHLAGRLSELPSDMRMRLGVEAGRRGADLDEWWEVFSAQLPLEVGRMKEGSASWSIGLAHLLIHPPTDRWQRLTSAMAHTSHAVMAKSHLVDVKLPAIVGSAERSYQAGLAVARQLGESYGAYYSAMYDVSSILSARMARGGNAVAAEKIHLAGLMWDMRAKVASTISLHTADGTSHQAGAFATRHGTYHVTTSPYPAYHRWHREVNKASCVTRDVKSVYPHHAPPRLSDAFRDIRTPLFSAPAGTSSRLLRYAKFPGQLAIDIERTLALICADVRAVMAQYDDEASVAQAARAAVPGPGSAIVPPKIDLTRFVPTPGSFWDMVDKMEPLSAADLVDAVTRLDAASAAEIEGTMFESEDALRAAVWGADEERVEAVRRARDSVV